MKVDDGVTLLKCYVCSKITAAIGSPTVTCNMQQVPVNWHWVRCPKCYLKFIYEYNILDERAVEMYKTEKEGGGRNKKK